MAIFYGATKNNKRQGSPQTTGVYVTFCSSGMLYIRQPGTLVAIRISEHVWASKINNHKSVRVKLSRNTKHLVVEDARVLASIQSYPTSIKCNEIEKAPPN